MKRGPLLLVFLLATASAHVRAQDAISAANLRKHLFTLAADSMAGRDTGSREGKLATDYIAAEFKRLGLEPAGENGTYFQTIPFVHVHPDTAAPLVANGRPLTPGRDFMPVGPRADWNTNQVAVVFGGVAGEASSWPTAEQVKGRFVVFTVPSDVVLRTLNQTLGRTLPDARFADVAGIAIVFYDRIPQDMKDQMLQGGYTTEPALPAATRPLLLITQNAARALLGGDPASVRAGTSGATLSGGFRFRRDPLEYPARTVLAVVPGTDAKLRNTYVSMSAHNDHVGRTFAPVDHDSVYAYNRVVRPMGADSPDRPATPAELARVNAIRDSLRALRPSKRDSVFNGADDDGTGTVALLESARVLSAKPAKRSILLVSHAAEERGLLGSKWFTDNPTVPRDSIIGEVDMDMIGRGNATDLPEGGAEYLEVIGARRVSREFGDVFEKVNARLPQPFRFNYEYDKPGHPLQYYCRADHYSYARYGIPALAMSRGEHADYHQVTDEPEYIDYNALARVATLATEFVRELGNMDHRPAIDAPRGDPHAPCRQ